MPLAMNPLDLTEVEALLYGLPAELAVSPHIKIVLLAPPGPQKVIYGLLLGTSIFSLNNTNTVNHWQDIQTS